MILQSGPFQQGKFFFSSVASFCRLRYPEVAEVALEPDLDVLPDDFDLSRPRLPLVLRPDEVALDLCDLEVDRDVLPDLEDLALPLLAAAEGGLRSFLSLRAFFFSLADLG